MTVLRHEFGSIAAVCLPDDRIGQVRAGEVVLHTVASAQDVAALISFWHRQHAAPSAEAVICALAWIAERFYGAGGAEAR